MNDVKDAVFNYLKMDSTGALLITGHWGAGKTYYIKNTLFEEIKYSKEFKYKPVMVSLYGENDVSKISTKIIQSLISTGIISAKKITKGLSGIFNSFPILRRYFDPDEFINLLGGGVFELLNKNNIVLFFDDLERLGKELPTNDFLGYVNDLTENKKCKIIIVSHDGEIKDEFTYKEKTISKTVVFTMETEVAFMSLKRTYDNTPIFYDFLKGNQDFFLETLSTKVTNAESNLSEKFKKEVEIDFRNIRTLKSALEHFKMIFHYIENSKDITNEVFKQKAKNLWCFCLAITIEARKSGGLKLNDTKEIDNGSPFFVGLLIDEKDERTDDDFSFLEIFKKKYFERLEEPYFFYSSIYAFITAGKSIDPILVNEQLNSNFKSEDNKLSPQYQIYQDFMSFKRSQLSNSEFIEKIELLLKYAESGDYSEYSEYVNIAIFLFGFKDYFTEPKENLEIDLKLKKGVIKFSKDRGFEYQWGIHREAAFDEVHDENVLNIIKFIDNIVATKKQEQIKSEVSQWEELLLKSPKQFMIDNIENTFQGIMTKQDPVFSYFDIQAIIKRISEWQAEDILMFSTILEKRYLKGYIFSLEEEFKNVLLIVDYIIEYDFSEKTYSNYYIEKTLLPIVRQVKTKIEQTSQILESEKTHSFPK